jgi:pyroglutamyl-peptidase
MTHSGNGSRFLFTGFEPFAEHAHNPSILAAQAAARAVGARASTQTLPVVWDAVPGAVADIAHDPPRCVVLFGLAANRDRVSVERRARNIAGRQPDNAGVVAKGKLDDDDTDAVATIDADALADYLAAAGLGACVSEDAGEYLCNAFYRAVLHHPALRDVAAVFVHIPDVDDARAAEIGGAVGSFVAARY